jgi:phosphatidylserine decarboxylase
LIPTIVSKRINGRFQAKHGAYFERIGNFSIPYPFRGPVLRAYASHSGIDMAEAERDICEYASIQELFTRKLRPGIRPQSSKVPGFVNSPCDGTVRSVQKLHGDSLLQAKGFTYTVAELLTARASPKVFSNAWVVNIYLGAADYHCIHAPFEGTAHLVLPTEGERFSVREQSAETVPKLYARNKRTIWSASGRAACQGMELAMVLVGAMEIGNIRIDEPWNKLIPGEDGDHDWETAAADVVGEDCEAGDMVGGFEFGSTVILLITDNGSKGWTPTVTAGETVRVGQRLGAVPTPPPLVD